MASTITVSWSEIDSFRQCPLKHELSYKERWVSGTTSEALSRGTDWHTILAAHYNLIRAKQHSESFDRWEKELRAALAVEGDQGDLLRWMYEGYIEMWGTDPDWEVLAVEHAAEVWLPTPNGGRSRFKLKMKADLVVRDKVTHKVWLVDHKSHKNLPNRRMLELDDQFGLYTWGLRQLGNKVFGFYHSAARTQRNKDPESQTLESRFARTPDYRTDAELDLIALDAYRTVRRAYAIPVGEAERATNPETCRWKCDYVQPCLGSRKGIDLRRYLKDAGFAQNFERH